MARVSEREVIRADLSLLRAGRSQSRPVKVFDECEVLETTTVELDSSVPWPAEDTIASSQFSGHCTREMPLVRWKWESFQIAEVFKPLVSLAGRAL